jgi:LysR family transcriptional regulator, mexEF-oprN operon transcriptional activator
MPTIDHFNLRSFDLNLLVAFDALMTEGSVTKAAERLRIRQPAMSHSLSTLRVLLQDELFIRVGQVMQPTARARSLAGPVRHALRQAEVAISKDQQFSPSTVERTFRIAMLPELELLLVPDLTARMRRLAPGIRILAQTFPYERAITSLEDGGLDLAIGCGYDKRNNRSFETLYQMEFVCCFNPTILPLVRPVSLEAYLRADHVTISQTETLQGCVKNALEVLGIELNIVAAAPGYMSVLSAAQVSPIIATVPRRVAERYATLMELQFSALPVALHFPPVEMAWARHADEDPASMWLRQHIRSGLASSCATSAVRADAR